MVVLSFYTRKLIIPAELLPLANGVIINETKLSLDGLLKLYNAALLRVRDALPSQEEVAGVTGAVPQLTQLTKEHAQQLAATRVLNLFGVFAITGFRRSMVH